MRMTTLLAAAVLLGGPGRTLAQNTPEENQSNADAPFVRNIRADQPGQTLTAQVLRPGTFQLETGLSLSAPTPGLPLPGNYAALRIGFFNSMELRVRQGYVRDHAGSLEVPNAGGWVPLLVGTKLMLSPNYDTRTQVALLVETALPGTGANALEATTFAPAGRLLVSQQIGQRFGLEGNFGFSQQGLTVADIKAGQYLGSLALNGPLSRTTGFFLEGYGVGRQTITTGTTAGIYWRPAPVLRLDLNAGRMLGGLNAGRATVGAGLVLKLGK